VVRVERERAAGQAIVDAMGPHVARYYGTKIDPANVSQIENGVSTRSQVEALFGPPQNVSVMDSGGRMMTYIYFSYSTSDRHTLQITLNSDNVVRDHEYNMNAKLTRTRGGWEFGGVNYPDEKK
jgi:outer membrane protein assembly factor BamE (lipoprotein component of BamABCDE complex)